MKKSIIALVLALMMALTCIGCAAPAAEAPAVEAPAAEAAESSVPASSFNFYLAGATPGGGGVWDMVGAGVAETIMKSNDKCYVTVVPGGGVSDVTVVANQEAELGLTHNVVAQAGTLGIDPFDVVYDNVVSVCALYPSMFQFITAKGYAASIKEIVDNKMPIRIAVGDPGSTGELGTSRMFAAYGASYEDIESWGGKVYYKDMSEASTMLGDGLIDAMTLWTLAPAGPVQEVSVNKDVTLLPIDAEIVDKLNADYGYSKLSIAKDAYAFLEGDIATIGSKVVIITNTQQSEADIYNVVRSMAENIDYIKSIHSNLSSLSVEEMALTDNELHPGAAKYYKEIGVLN